MHARRPKKTKIEGLTLYFPDPAITGHVLGNGLAVVAMRLHARIPGITTEGFHPWWVTSLGVLVTAAGMVAFHRATRAARNASAKELVAS